MSIKIFSTSYCSSCAQVKRWLDYKGVNYEVVDVSDSPELRQEAMELSGGITTVPITVIQDGDKCDVVIGYNLAALSRALTV